MMSSMSTKEDLEKAVAPLTKSVAKLEEQVQNLTTSFSTFENKVKKDMENMEKRLNAVEVALSTGVISEESKTKFDEIQKQIEALKLEKTRPSSNLPDNQMDCTAVFGNFTNVTAEQAEAWISTECGKLGTGQITKQYFKEKFSTIMWVVFESSACRDAVLEKIQKAWKLSMWSCEGVKVWVKEDALIDERVTRSLLFGTKFLLASWGYQRDFIWVDMESSEIKCGAGLVFKMSITDGILQISYGEGWDTWELFQNDADLKKLIETAKAKLSKATAQKGKGKGKKGKWEKTENGVGGE